MNILKEQNRNTVYASLALLVLFFFIIHRLVSGQGSLFERCSSYITYPLIQCYAQVFDPIKKYQQNRKTIQELQELVEQLQHERNDLVAQVVRLQAINNYATNTQSLETFKQRYMHPESAITQILVRHFSDQGHYFLVDAGEKHGITVDMVAVINNVLIGRVTHVYAWYSKVTLITDRTCKVAAVCATTQTTGIHEGTNGEHTLLRYISHLSPVQPGELIISSGQGLVFPQGFGLGTVEKVSTQGLDTEVAVKPVVDLKQLNYCLLLDKANLTVAANSNENSST